MLCVAFVFELVDPMGVHVWRKFEETDRNDKVSRCDSRFEYEMWLRLEMLWIVDVRPRLTLCDFVGGL